MLTPGGIYQTSRCSIRSPGCLVSVAGSKKILEQRRGKSAHVQPEIHLAEKSGSTALGLIDAVFFNGTFSGLAYGLEDPPVRSETAV